MKAICRVSGWLLVLVLVACLVPSAFGTSGKWNREIGSSANHLVFANASAVGVVNAALNPWGEKHRRKVTVPEGGSSLLYLGLAGIACLGAVVWRARWRASHNRSM